MKEKAQIPNLIPAQFDDYIFSQWKSPQDGLFEKFHIERIEIYKNNLKLPLLPHRRSVNFLMFISQGKVRRSKGLTMYEILPGNFFFMPAFQINSLEFVSDDAKGFYCHFDQDIFNISHQIKDLAKVFPFFQFSAEPLLFVPDSDRIIQLLTILYEEIQKNKLERFEILPLYLFTIFTELKYLIPTSLKIKNDASTHLTQRYKNALSTYIYEKKSVADFAEYLSVSPNHLNKSVKSTTGQSAHNLLEDMRILEAQVLLRQTNLSVGDIAYKIGKFDSSDFSRFFKNKVKLTPNQYRKNQY